MGKVLPKPLASNDPSKIGCVSASTASDMGAYFDSVLAHVPHKSDMLHNPLLRDAATQATMAPTRRDPSHHGTYSEMPRPPHGANSDRPARQLQDTSTASQLSPTAASSCSSPSPSPPPT